MEQFLSKTWQYCDVYSLTVSVLWLLTLVGRSMNTSKQSIIVTHLLKFFLKETGIVSIISFLSGHLTSGFNQIYKIWSITFFTYRNIVVWSTWKRYAKSWSPRPRRISSTQHTTAETKWVWTYSLEGLDKQVEKYFDRPENDTLNLRQKKTEREVKGKEKKLPTWSHTFVCLSGIS